MRKILGKEKYSAGAILLTLYMFIVWALYLCLNHFHSRTEILVLLAVTFVLCLEVAKVTVRIAGKVVFKEKKDITGKQKGLVFLLFTLITLAVMSVWCIAYFPGSYAPDCIVQLSQVISGEYCDMHPVWHTLCFFALPLKLAGTTDFIVPFQMICFSLTIGYVALVLYKHSNFKFALISVICIIFNPFLGYLLIHPIKDIGLAIAGSLAMAMAVEIYFDRSWADKWWRLILLGFILVCATLFRHNAVLFTFVLLVALVLNLNKKQAILLVTSFVVIIVTIKGPVYSALHVEKADRRILETMGLPLNIIGNSVKEAPERLDAETLAFAYSLATPEAWYQYYHKGNFNELKTTAFDSKSFEAAGVGYILKTTAKCIRYAPKESLQGFAALTDELYGTEYITGDFLAMIKENDLGVYYKGNDTLGSYFEKYREFINNSIFRYFRINGCVMLLLVVVVTSKIDFRKKEDWKRLLIALSIFVHNFGTMLLLTGCEARYFYFTFIVAPLIVVLMLKEKPVIENTNCTENAHEGEANE